MDAIRMPAEGSGGLAAKEIKIEGLGERVGDSSTPGDGSRMPGKANLLPARWQS
jgi:hypothetical protein